MIFAFATDEKTLTVFSDEKEAVSYCEGFDVSQGGWLFFAGDGSPLEPLFSVPASKPGFVITHGRYSLRSATTGGLGHLASLLPSVAEVEGISPLNTIADIERLLTHHSSGTR